MQKRYVAALLLSVQLGFGCGQDTDTEDSEVIGQTAEQLEQTPVRAASEEEYVLTPHGRRIHKSCMHELAENAKGEFKTKKGVAVKDVPPCKYVELGHDGE